MASAKDFEGQPPDIETAKRAAAKQAVEDNFPKDPRFVGIGSGTTIVYVVEAIKELGQDVSRVCFVPTGYQSRQLIINAGLIPIQFESLPTGVLLDIAFDGADEVDDDLNCIKGGGACLFQEKLVAMRARKFVCVADHRKLKSRLLTDWKTIPIEVAPIAARHVIDRLRGMGSPGPFVREGQMAKAGPIKTDQDFFIVDAPFPKLLIGADVDKDHKGDGSDGTWEVEHLARKILTIHGVLEVGIFSGYTGPEGERYKGVGGQRPIKCYFGMPDGTVTVKDAPHKVQTIIE